MFKEISSTDQNEESDLHGQFYEPNEERFYSTGLHPTRSQNSKRLINVSIYKEQQKKEGEFGNYEAVHCSNVYIENNYLNEKIEDGGILYNSSDVNDMHMFTEEDELNSIYNLPNEDLNNLSNDYLVYKNF